MALSPPAFTAPASAPRPAWVALLMLASGFAALAYQIVWTQQLGTWLGHEVAALLAVVAAFFGGLGLGAWLLGPRIARSRRPGRWYAALEAVIGAWALLLLLALPAAGALLTRLIGDEAGPLRQWALAFAGPLLLLLPATAAMGATLPAMERVLGRLRDRGYAIGGLYALNTAGAVAGVLAAAFWLAPQWGFNATAAAAAVLNLGCAAVAWVTLGSLRRGDDAASAPATPAAPDAQGTATAAASPPPRALLLLGLSGLLGIGTEVLVVRALSQMAENTVYTYAMLLAVYLCGTAAGAAAFQRWLAGNPDANAVRTRLVAAVLGSTLLAVLVLAAAPGLQAAALQRWGSGFGVALSVEAGLGLLAFALPTLAMGALFSQLAVEARAAGWSFGHALAANTAGATLAAPLFGVLLLPLLGVGALLAAVAAAYLLLLPARAWRSAWAWAPAAGAAAMLVAGPGLRHVVAPPGGQVLSHVDGVLGAVSVTVDGEGVRRLHINNREQEGSSITRVGDARQAWVPLLWHPNPQRVLFLGLGTGVTASAAAQDPRLRVRAVELLPEVVDAAALFVPALADRTARGVPQVVVADARRHVRASREQHDVIVADLFHPARSGSAALFTAEHFAAVQERLAPGGLFMQWLPLHQLDLGSLRSIVAAFLRVYPDAVAVLATNSLDTPVLGLMGRDPALQFTPALLAQRLAQAQRGPGLNGLQLDDPWAAAGSVIGDATALQRFAGDATPNRDDHPVVAWRAPQLRDGGGDGPRQRLRAVVEALDAEPGRVFALAADGTDAATDAAWEARINAYWRARDHYLLAGLNVRPVPNLQAMLAQVREPLLQTLRLSPDFRPAYDPLLRMALALQREDPTAAQALLTALDAVQPQRPEAGQALQALMARL